MVLENHENYAAYPSLTLEDRYLCDLDMLLLGAFSPLEGFLDEKDYVSVVEKCRLANGALWSMPIVLPVCGADHERLKEAENVLLKDKTGLPIAVLEVGGARGAGGAGGARYKPDLLKECINVYGSDDTNHPYVKIVMGLGEDCYYYGGKVVKIRDVVHYDFVENRMSAEESRAMIARNGWKVVVGFQTRNPMHRSHFELTKFAVREAGEEAKLLLTPVVGVTQLCDVNYHVRVRCYQKLMPYYAKEGVEAELVLLPLSMRMAGPREALWHAQIRKNYGCTHFIVGRDHAGPSYKKKNGESFYGPYDAHRILNEYKDELGVEIILSKMIVYIDGVYKPENEISAEDSKRIMNISGTEQRRLLNDGEEIPEWFSFPEIVEELRCEYKHMNRRGLCLYFTGLSGSGKSTLANCVMQKIMETEKHRNISLLDADIIRTHLSKGLGFSKEDRSANVRRIGYVSSEIVKHNGIVLVANIAPYLSDRAANRELISGGGTGNYVEIYVKTSLEMCEKRDVKGLYKLAREGKIKEFTGISDPYEEPIGAEIVVDGGDELDVIVGKIVGFLREKEYI
jgi:sulfate adenylyltransferase